MLDNILKKNKGQALNCNPKNEQTQNLAINRNNNKLRMSKDRIPNETKNKEQLIVYRA